MKRNHYGRQTHCIVAARSSSLVITISEFQASLGMGFQFICVVGMVALAAFAAHLAYKDMIQLSRRVESIEESSRTINEFVQITVSGLL